MASSRPWWVIHSTGRRWLDVVAVVLILVVLAVITFPFFAQAEVYSGPGTGGSVHSVGQDLNNWARRGDGRYPNADTWMDELGWENRTAKDLMRGPKRERKDFGIVFFKPLSGVRVESIKNPEKVPLAFISTLNGHNASSGLETLAWLGEEKKRTWICFVDGHIELMPYEWRFETIVLEIGE